MFALTLTMPGALMIGVPIVVPDLVESGHEKALVNLLFYIHVGG